MKLRERLTFANVVSVLALIVATTGGGAAYALAKNTVGSPQIIDGAVKKIDLGGGAVTGPKVKDGALAGKDFHPKAHGMLQAGMFVQGPGTPTKWFNRLGNGGAPSVDHYNTGRYRVTVPGANFSGSGNTIALASSRNYLRECRVMSANAGELTIYCTDNSDSSFQNASFDLIIIKS